MAQQVRATSVMIMIIKIMHMIFSAQHRMTSNSRTGACADANGSLGEGCAVKEESNSILKTKNGHDTAHRAVVRSVSSY